jgi:phage antirepressor YoqD-like protein
MSNIVHLADYKNKEVVIGDITIQQDDEGRYCLNDFHKAAGGERKDDTREWLATKGAQELIQRVEAQLTGKSVIKTPGRYGGTFAVKELVYAYAMWISADYYLKVIRAYDRMVTDGVAVHENAAQDFLNDPQKYIQTLKGQAQILVDENAQLKEQLEAVAPKVKVFDKFIDSTGVTTFQQFCTGLNLHQRKIKLWLRDIGWLRADQFEVNPLPTAKAVDHGYCVVKSVVTEYGHRKQQIKFTTKAEAYVELKAPDHVRKTVAESKEKMAA